MQEVKEGAQALLIGMEDLKVNEEEVKMSII